MATPLPYSNDARDWNPGLVLEDNDVQILKAAHLTDLTAGTNFLGTGDPFGVTVDSLPEYQSDGLVRKGQPVLLNGATPSVIGVAINSAVADDDNNVIGVITRGIVAARVFGFNDAGANAAVAKWDPLYFNLGNVDADQLGTIIPDATDGTLIGWALDAVTGGENKVIAILLAGAQA